jgi:hypothetical protein
MGKERDGNSPSRTKSLTQFKEMVASGEIVSIPPREKEKITDLPRWVKTALIMKEVDGMNYTEAAKRFSKAGSTLAEYGKSPAAKEWISHLAEFVEDPLAMAKAYLSANALSVSLDRLVFLQAAIDAGDYREGDKIARDLQDRMGIVAKKQDAGAISVKIQLGGSTLESPIIEADWTEVSKDDE